LATKIFETTDSGLECLDACNDDVQCVAFALRDSDGQCYIYHQDTSDYVGAGPFDPMGNWSCFISIEVPQSCESSPVYGAAEPETPIAPVVVKNGVMARVMWEAPENNGLDINGYEVGIL
jgi:hypothetical protein